MIPGTCSPSVPGTVTDFQYWRPSWPPATVAARSSLTRSSRPGSVYMLLTTGVEVSSEARRKTTPTAPEAAEICPSLATMFLVAAATWSAVVVSALSSSACAAATRWWASLRMATLRSSKTSSRMRLDTTRVSRTMRTMPMLRVSATMRRPRLRLNDPNASPR